MCCHLHFVLSDLSESIPCVFLTRRQGYLLSHIFIWLYKLVLLLLRRRFIKFQSSIRLSIHEIFFSFSVASHTLICLCFFSKFSVCLAYRRCYFSWSMKSSTVLAICDFTFHDLLDFAISVKFNFSSICFNMFLYSIPCFRMFLRNSFSIDDLRSWADTNFFQKIDLSSSILT